MHPNETDRKVPASLLRDEGFLAEFQQAMEFLQEKPEIPLSLEDVRRQLETETLSVRPVRSRQDWQDWIQECANMQSQAIRISENSVCLRGTPAGAGYSSVAYVRFHSEIWMLEVGI